MNGVVLVAKMADIIEIGSSSPLTIPDAKVEAKKTTFQIPFDFKLHSDDSEDWDSTNIIDRPSKRRRITPQRREQKSVSAFRVFDLSSDYEELPELKKTTLASAKNQSHRVNAASTSFDDITFSSSAPELGQSKASALSKTWVDSQDDINVSFGTDFAEPGYSHRTAQLLATLSQPISQENKVSQPARVDTVRKAAKSKLGGSRDEIVFTSSPERAKPLKRSKRTVEAKSSRDAEKDGERERKRLERDAERQAEKERKQLERERKAQEKQKAADLAEVNKSRTNKKSTAPEMIVDVTSLFQGTSIGNQVEEYMKQADIEMHYFDEEINWTPGVERDLYGNIIRWRRKVGSAYNDEQGLWEPTSRTRIQREEHVLIHMPAPEFVATMVTSNPVSSLDTVPREEAMKANLDAHVVALRSRYHPCIPIYVVEGMNTWLKKNANAKNRQYAAAVRAQMEDLAEEPSNAGSSSTQSRSKKRKKTAAASSIDLSFITSEQVEDILLHLQLAHQPIFIQHTASPANTAFQILTLTQQLSTRPYRLAQLDYNLRNASFCMDSGQVKTGENAKETFAKMLQEVQRVTPSMAYGIIDGWSSVRKLVGGFERHGNLLLEDVRKSLNKDGAWSERRLGPMVSKRLYKVFMGRDPTATDGMS